MLTKETSLLSVIILSAIIAFAAFGLTGCGSSSEESSAAPSEVRVSLFAASSMSDAMDKVAEMYQESNPDVTISAVYDSSGTLLAQIQEAGGCDVFFSAAQKQMDQLQEDGLVVKGTRHNLVNNQLILMTSKDSGTSVTGIRDLEKAESLAIAGGTVPAGNYTRIALTNAGILGKTDDPSAITSKEISETLGGTEINECENVGAAAQAVSEGSNECGTCYYSDFIKYTKQGFDLEVVEKVDQRLTGDIIYPICQVVNSDADEAEIKASADFIDYCMSDHAKRVYEEFGFDINVAD